MSKRRAFPAGSNNRNKKQNIKNIHLLNLCGFQLPFLYELMTAVQRGHSCSLSLSLQTPYPLSFTMFLLAT